MNAPGPGTPAELAGEPQADSSAGPLESCLSWRGRLPLSWRVLERAPDEAELERCRERNARMLDALALLEEGHARQSEDSSPLLQQMERLEAKFDLVISLLSEFMLPEDALPASTEIAISANGLWLATDRPAPPAALVELDIQFCPTMPRPIRLHGTVLEPSGTCVDGMLVAFAGMAAVDRERLERLVFRRHRRAIALQRPGPRTV